MSIIKRYSESMDELSMYYAKLSIPGRNNTELSYVFADELPEQKNSSVLLFGLFDVSSSSELYHTIIKESVKHYLDFYHNGFSLDTLASDELPDSREFAFENSIQYTYEKVSDSLREMQEHSSHRNALDLKKINCILGALIDDTLFLSITGSDICPYLIYPVSHRKGPIHYMLINIADNSDDQARDVHVRLFSTVISGSVSIPSSILFFCNRTFADYISPQQIKQAISNMRADTIIPHFEHLLSRVRARNDFSALLIARDTTDVPLERSKAIRRTASSASMDDLNGTASSTQSIMTPTMRPIVSRGLRTGSSMLIGSFHAVGRLCIRIYQYLTAPKQRQHYQRIGNSIVHFANKMSSSLPRIGAVLFARVQNIRASIRDGSAQEKLIGTVHSSTNVLRRHIIRIREWFLAQTPLSRSLLVLSILFIVLFIASIISLQARNSTQQREARVQEILAGIGQKLLSLDASLIYNDRPRARDLITESEQLLSLIDERFRNDPSVVKTRQELDVARFKVDNIISINDATELGVLPGEAAQPLSLTALDGTLVVSTADTIYRYEGSQKQLIELQVHEKIPTIGCAGARSESELFFCSLDGTRLYTLALADTGIRSSSLTAAAEGAPNRILFYNDRMYSFFKSNGMLYRHNRAGDGYGTGLPWITDGSDSLKGARDVAIDGLVYVLSVDGSLLVLRSGKLTQDQIPAGTRNALSGAQRLIASSNLEYIYALNPETKRIIIIDKRGYELIGQITSPMLIGPRDFGVSKQRKSIVVLDGNKLIALPYDVK